MKKIASLVGVMLLVTLSVGSGHACSMASCLNDGIEMQPDFVVAVTHDEAPLAGVSVKVRSFSGEEPRVWFSGVTDKHGNAHVTNLAPGNYWIEADLLGVPAGEQCFHVREKSEHAVGKLKYEWGESPTGVRQINGVLTDLRPGTGGTPVQNLIHLVRVPITGIGLRLQNPLTGESYSTKSDDNGAFTFGSAPPGTYVLHIEGGMKLGSRIVEPTDLLVELSATARLDNLPLVTSDICGSTYFALDDQKRKESVTP
jgi:hypothetical protein